jgi:hypothetical protein
VVAVSDFAEDDHGLKISRLKKPWRLNTEARREGTRSAADAGSAGVGHYGLDRDGDRAKSSWLGGSRAGLRSVVERAGLEPATSWVR